MAIPALQCGGTRSPPGTNFAFEVEHHHDRDGARPRREVCIHDVEIRVAGQDSQLSPRGISEPSDQRHGAETIAAPVLTEDKESRVSRARAHPFDQLGRDDGRPVHPLPELRMLRHRLQVRRKTRCGIVTRRVDRERHRDGVTPIGRSAGGREYDSVTVSVWFRSTSVPLALKMTCSRNPTSVRQFRVRR